MIFDLFNLNMFTNTKELKNSNTKSKIAGILSIFLLKKKFTK